MRLFDSHASGLHARIFKREIADLRREMLQQCRAAAFDDPFGFAINFDVVHRVVQVVGLGGELQIAIEFDVHDEHLSQLVFGGMAAVKTEKLQTGKQNFVHAFNLTISLPRTRFAVKPRMPCFSRIFPLLSCLFLGATGVARADAGDWLGAPPANLSPVEVTRPLIGVPVADSGARIFRVDLEARQIAPSALFSPDGKWLYLLGRKVGVLQIEMPSFRLVRTLPLPCEGGTLALSREGLVVGSGEEGTIWIVNPTSLRLVRSFKVDAAQLVTATPRSPLVFAGDGKSKLLSLDARSGDVVAYEGNSFQFDAHADTNTDAKHQPLRIGDIGAPLLAPDAKTLYCTSSGTIFKFTLQGRTLVPDSNSDQIGTAFNRGAPGSLALSPDGRYIALPAENGADGNSFGGSRGPNLNETWIFKTGDLREPVLRLEGTVRPRSVGFDPTAGRLYVSLSYNGFGGGFGTVRPVMVFSAKGELLASLTLPRKEREGFGSSWDNPIPGWPGGGWTDSYNILVYPGGNRFLLGTQEGLFWFELPQTFTAPTPDSGRNTGGFNRGGFGGFNNNTRF